MTVQSRLRLRLRAIDEQVAEAAHNLRQLRRDREEIARRLQEIRLQDADVEQTA